MKNIKRNRLVIIFLGVILMVSIFSENHLIRNTQKNASSENTLTPLDAADPITIAVSIAPQLEWVKAVGGSLLNVESLIPDSSSPHTYLPTSKELTLISNAEVWFQIGVVDFDITQNDNMKENSPGLEVVNLTKDIELLSIQSHTHDDGDEVEGEGNVDPHVWLSISRVIKMVKVINETLCELDPPNNSTYSNNTATYIGLLGALKVSIEGALESVVNRKMLVFHPSWGYFCDEFNLTQIALEEEGKDPSSEHFKDVVDLVQENEVGVIFVQEQISKSVAESFSQNACTQLVVINPLPVNYIEDLFNASQIIAESLDLPPKCTGSNTIWYVLLAGGVIIGAIYIFIQKKKEVIED